MFWKYNNPSWSMMDSLLAKEDVTLQELMDSEDIISNCRIQNKGLIDFLLRPEVMGELVSLTTREPSNEIEAQNRFKYPNIASELLTCDVPVINERLAGDERLLAKLYEFLEGEPPLNPLLASYFSKIMGGLIAKMTDQVLDFLKARETFLPLLMKHLGTSAIMDFMLKLMTQVEGIEMRQNILNWLDSQRIIQQLICLLNPTVEKERHDNVAQLLCDFVRTARDTLRNSTERTDPDPLLNTLEAPDTVRLILDQIFNGEKCESSIVGGISVLLALLDVNQTKCTTAIANNIYGPTVNEEPVDVEQKQKIVRNTTEAIAVRLKDFHNLLVEPPKQSPVLTTVGVLDPPLGQTRLQVVRMLAHLVPAGQGQLHDQLMELGTFDVLLDLFFKYPWNNFVHTQVENCIVAALEQTTTESETSESPEISPLCTHLIVNSNVIERVLQAWKDNDEQQRDKKAIRQGYMGHLISLVTRIVQLKSSTPLGDRLKELKPETAAVLEEFATTCLAEVTEQQDKLLGGLHPSSLMEDNDNYGDIPFPLNSALQQQNFAQYQMQNLSSQYIDGYSGFNDDAFNDGDDTLQTIDNSSDVNFDLSESEAMQRDDLFKQVCAQSINTLFDAEDQIFEDRDHTFQTVIEKKDQADNAEGGSGDSDDGSPPGGEGEDNMDVDLGSILLAWASPKADPWSALATTTTTSGDSPATGWADFSSAAFSQSTVFPASFAQSSVQDPKQESQTPPTTSTPPKDPLQTNKESRAEEKAPEVESAASGDHPDVAEELADKVEADSSGPQPSMSIEGDTCKTPADKPTPTTEKSPDAPAREQQEKV